MGPLLRAGLAPRVFAAADSFSSGLYLKTIPMATSTETSLQCQLHRRGIDPEEVRHVFLTHLHGSKRMPPQPRPAEAPWLAPSTNLCPLCVTADHIAGCADFPNATFHAGAACLELAQRRGCAASTHLLLPKLLPADFEDRACAIEQARECVLACSCSSVAPDCTPFDAVPARCTGLPCPLRPRPSPTATTCLAAGRCWRCRCPATPRGTPAS